MSPFTLTEEETTLHFYASLVQKDLDIYLTCVSRSGTDWKNTSEHHLVHQYYANYFII